MCVLNSLLPMNEWYKLRSFATDKALFIHYLLMFTNRHPSAEHLKSNNPNSSDNICVVLLACLSFCRVCSVYFQTIYRGFHKQLKQFSYSMTRIIFRNPFNKPLKLVSSQIFQMNMDGLFACDIIIIYIYRCFADNF